jgi:type 2 lantibiotic biosynthesis protein LanM
VSAVEALKYSYITERKYLDSKTSRTSKVGETDRFNSDVYQYWVNLLGTDIINDIEQSYQLNLDTILSSEIAEDKCGPREDIVDFQKLYFEQQHKRIPNGLIDFNGQEALFSSFYIPFINIGLNQLREILDATIERCVIKDFSTNLLEQINKVSVGTLIFEMHLCKKNHELHGDNAREEYLDYNNRMLNSQEYIQELMDIYPCLFRMISELIFNQVNNYSMVVKRLKKDHAVIVQELCQGQEFRDVVEFRSSISDSHKQGKTVVLITLDNDIKIVYKPRSLKIDIAYQEFLTFLSSSGEYRNREFKIIDSGEYGWEEFVSHIPCRSVQALERYYYRFGQLIFTHFMLGSNDLHKENLIASGEYPIVIDAETLLGNKRELPKNSARAVIIDTLRESVLYSGLLPQRHFSSKGGGIDLSAAKGRDHMQYPVAIPKIASMGTSDMHFVYEHPVTTATQNLPTVEGERYSITDFTSQVIAGFSASFKFVLENKRKVLDKIELFHDLKVRFVIQDTQKYYLLLHTSYHPDFLQDAKDRHLMLCTLFKNWEKIHDSRDITTMEITEMLNMDVPYFYIKTNCRSLYGCNDQEIPNYFPMTSMERLTQKIERLHIDDLKEQLRYIKISLSNMNDLAEDKDFYALSSVHKIKEATLNPDLWLRAVMHIADELIERGVLSADGSDINWLSIAAIGKDQDSTWDIRPLDTYLYEGLSGLSIFFNALNKQSSRPDINVICNALKNALFSYTDDMCAQNNRLVLDASGAFAGEGALLYTYEVLYRITCDDAYLEYAKKHAAVVKHAIRKDKGLDICYGNAGAILALLNLYTLTGEPEYLEDANTAGLVLLECQHQHEHGVYWIGEGGENPLAGFSHGITGIALALIRLGQATNHSEFIAAALSGIQFENTLYDSEHQNWKDERVFFGQKSSDNQIYMTAWCHGAAGILLGRTKMYPYVPAEMKESILQDINRALRTTITSGLTQNDCLCHGNLGNTEILQEYTSLFPENEVADIIQSSRAWIVNRICNGGSISSREYLFGYKIPGFMTGLAGIGYSLLRDLDGSLPCILALDL